MLHAYMYVCMNNHTVLYCILYYTVLDRGLGVPVLVEGEEEEEEEEERANSKKSTKGSHRHQ